MNHRLITLVLTICFVFSLFAFSNVSADVRSSGITITPFAGGYFFEGNECYDDGPIYGLGLGYRLNEHFSAELSMSYGNFEVSPCDYDSDCDHQYINGYGAYLDIAYDILPDFILVPYITAGVGALLLDYDREDEDPDYGIDNNIEAVFHYGGGVRFALTDQIDIRADVRHALTFDEKDNEKVAFDHYNNLEATLGFTLTLGKSKPTTVAMIGNDQDNDGVADSVDQCPNTVPNVSVNTFGCPYDTDKDGVYDYQDKCPETFSGETVDMFGCSKDSDSDGVVDTKDKCPGTPANVAVGKDGCSLDADSDGVNDYLDKCPNTPPGTLVDARGCKNVAGKDIRLNLKITFDSGKADIAKSSLDQVKAVAEVMSKYPNSKAVIEAHTDSSGSEKYNLDLSQKRADMVVHYLTNLFGIEKSRLRAVGYGESRPIADNRTIAGKKRNRRAVAIITSQ
ncbi:flagellar motor protein MotB [Candidatus Magnetomorum sp. HK-1]|nr:flagellar motor protein MotB [Candidatus Magnetomorum sp. HK-1]